MRRTTIAILVAWALAAGALPGVVADAARLPATAGEAGWAPAAAQPAGATARVATTLADGAVLLTGGGGEGGDAFADATRFDPATGSWRRAASLLTARYLHTGTPLADGRVLVAGGFAGSGFSVLGELYDPATDRWLATGSLSAARAGHIAARLPDGRVLVAGGYGGDAANPAALDSAEIYDPASGRWSPAAPLRATRGALAAATLPDGTILVVGGGEQPGAAIAAERYDPAADRWIAVAAPTVARIAPLALALADGSVLLVGGYDSGGEGRPIAQAERYIPATGRWVASGATPFPVTAVAAPLPDGGALAVGHTFDAAGRITEAQAARYDSLTNTWSPIAPPPGLNALRTATPLADGRVLVTGNYRDPQSTVQGPPGAAVAALYDGGVPARQCFAETGRCVSGLFLAYWLRHGGLALNGYPLGDAITQTLEDGQPYTVQYFERTRLEYHPENAGTPYQILLGQFGRRILADVPGAPTAPAAAQPGLYFPETGHTVTRQPFAAYWSANGGLAQFGYPLSEEFTQRLEDGNEYRVQYFERARFEYHPENSDPAYQVLLGQFGRRILGEAAPRTIAITPASGRCPDARTVVAVRGAGFTPGVVTRFTIRRDRDGEITGGNSMSGGKPANADGTYDNTIPLIGCGPDDPPSSTYTVTIAEYTPDRAPANGPGASATFTVTGR